MLTSRNISATMPKRARPAPIRSLNRRPVVRVCATAADPPVALVTGSNRGIGKAIAQELSKQGAKVCINYIDLPGFKEAAQETASEAIEAGAADAMIVSADVSKKEEIEAMVKAAIEKFGSLDIMVNNAGITKDSLVMRMSPDQWQAVIDLNLSGVFYCTQAACKVMSKQKSGRIVNIASVVGVIGNPGQANYTAAKASVIGLTKTVAREYASRGITCNAVAPGFIVTPMTAAIDKKYAEGILKGIPMGHYGQPEEVAGMVRFLAMDPAALYITGQVCHVDGGMVM